MWSIPDASEKVWDPHQGDVGLRHQRPQKQDVAAVANLTMRRVIAEATGKRIAEYPATIVLLKVSGCVRRNFDDLGALVTRSAIFLDLRQDVCRCLFIEPKFSEDFVRCPRFEEETLTFDA
jgi:hypothetical protein